MKKLVYLCFIALSLLVPTNQRKEVSPTAIIDKTNVNIVDVGKRKYLKNQAGGD